MGKVRRRCAFVSFTLTHNAMPAFAQHKDRKCDRGLITAGAAIFKTVSSEQTRRCLFNFLLVVLSDVDA